MEDYITCPLYIYIYTEIKPIIRRPDNIRKWQVFQIDNASDSERLDRVFRCPNITYLYLRFEMFYPELGETQKIAKLRNADWGILSYHLKSLIPSLYIWFRFCYVPYINVLSTRRNVQIHLNNSSTYTCIDPCSILNRS